MGEWLTRRILRSFADAGDEDELTRDSLSANKIYRPEEPAAPSRRDTDEMLDRVSRSETQSNDVWRRIEEQLKGVARRMDTQERSQTENQRAMSKAATEMNIAAREQAQAFDQLGAHVIGLADRLERVERSHEGGGLKEAVKGLHSGLSRVADQIAQNANQSAAQISSIVTNLEAVAGKLGEVREDAENTAQSLEHRIMTFDDRIYAAEKFAKTSAAALERALEALQARMREDVEAARTGTHGAIARLEENVGRLEARGSEVEHVRTAIARLEENVDRLEARGTEVDHAAIAIAKLEENVGRLEARGTDPEIEHRLNGVERSLGSLLERLENNEPGTAKAIEDTLKKLVNRVEATENRQRDSVSEFRAILNEVTARLTTLETKPVPASESFASPAFPPPPTAAFVPPPAAAFAPPPAAAFAPPPAFDPLPFPDVSTPGAAPPFPAQNDPFVQPQAFDSPPPFADDNPFEPTQDFAGDAFAATPTAGDSYLSAARRSARAAASAAENETSSRGFSWNSAAKAENPEANSGRTRIVLIAFAVLVAIALIAGIVLSRGFSGPSAHPSGLSAAFPAKQQSVPQAATPLHALSPQADDNTETAPATSNTDGQPAPLPQQNVVPAPIHSVPSAALKPVQTASIPALDRLTALANRGNAKAELVVGLKYLNGDGVAVNEAQAAKWLERSAESGEPVAQYRLGTLYEHGKGVAADPVKATHWYQAAAMQGNRKAMHNLAVAFAEGTGVKKDYAEAARWFSKAASMGLADSQFNLAVLYERGQGVPQSLLDAYKWYAVAAANGDIESKSRIEALATQLSADDRAAAQHAADTFRATSTDPHSNVAPQQSDLPQG